MHSKWQTGCQPASKPNTAWPWVQNEIKITFVCFSRWWQFTNDNSANAQNVNNSLLVIVWNIFCRWHLFRSSTRFGHINYNYGFLSSNWIISTDQSVLSVRRYLLFNGHGICEVTFHGLLIDSFGTSDNVIRLAAQPLVNDPKRHMCSIVWSVLRGIATACRLQP